MNPRNELAFVFFVFAISTALADLTCLDRNSAPVPWFSLIKYPGKLTESSKRYAYLDPNLGSSYQIVLGSSCDEKDQPLTYTIEAINAVSKKSLNLLLFNDEPPISPAKSDGAHAKGIFAYDNSTKTGVYIMHSLPNFPNVTTTDGHIHTEAPNTTETYGQNVYCISVNEDTIGDLINGISIEHLHVYYASGLFEDLSSRPISDVTSTISQFNLIDGEDQWFLTKSPKYDGFLFENIIGPYFKTALSVESWGRPYQNASCPPDSNYATVNIDTIAFNTQDTWSHTNDHSKWAITFDDDVKLACMCDMNRMTSQKIRGGGCLCSKNSKLYTALSSIIVLTDTCQTIGEKPYSIDIYQLIG